MALKLYNSLTRQEETFEPLEPKIIKMYVCGVTVYDYCHLGHARSYIAWDTMRRYLIWQGYQVRYVQNFTDIDDKILKRARETGSSMDSVAKRFTEAYFEDMKRLNVLEADEYPRATQNIDRIQNLIHDLEKKGFAYSSGGDVYYQVREFSQYGKLSGRRLEEMQAGASGRVDSEDLETAKKKDPFDFALWKAAKTGEPAWDSPWGKGRPGWHIECSAMVQDCLGETIDIHAGGADLIFPHHENEIAQSEASTGKILARYWLHNGFVTINGEKMSKSLGNFTTIRDLLDQPVDPMALRMFVLTAQYRKPIDFTEEAIASAKNGWNTIKEGILFPYQYGPKLGWEMPAKNLSDQTLLLTSYLEKFQKAMDDDINTPAALAILFELAKDLRREGNVLIHEGKTETSLEELKKQWVTLVSLSQVLGLEVKIEEQVSNISEGLSNIEIESLIQQRLEAKKAKNYSEADRIRNELQSQGIKLIDKSGGLTNWHRN